MNTIQLLLVKGKGQNVEAITAILSAEQGWHVVIASSDEEAIERFHLQPFDVVLLSPELEACTAKKLKTIFMIQEPDIILLAQSQEDAETKQMIVRALGSKKMERWGQIRIKDTLNVQNLEPLIRWVPAINHP